MRSIHAPHLSQPFLGKASMYSKVCSTFYNLTTDLGFYVVESMFNHLLEPFMLKLFWFWNFVTHFMLLFHLLVGIPFQICNMNTVVWETPNFLIAPLTYIVEAIERLRYVSITKSAVLLIKTKCLPSSNIVCSLFLALLMVTLTVYCIIKKNLLEKETQIVNKLTKLCRVSCFVIYNLTRNMWRKLK